MNFQAVALTVDGCLPPSWGYFPLRVTKGEAFSRGQKWDFQFRRPSRIAELTFTPVGFLTYMGTGCLKQVGKGAYERSLWRWYLPLMNRCEAISQTETPGELLFTVHIDPPFPSMDR